jgi:protein-export membrane protein SecD
MFKSFKGEKKYMKRVGKPVFFIVAALIMVFTYLSFFGFSTMYGDKENIWVKGAEDIRFGIDIRGGVDVTFTPPKNLKNVTKKQMSSAESVITQRLVGQNITDNEVYTDFNKNRIIVRFPWKENEKNFNPEEAIKELGETAEMTFREGKDVDENGKPKGVTASTIILKGDEIKEATVTQDEEGKPAVSFELNSVGEKKFAEATQRLQGSGSISIWMDNMMISAPTVNTAILNGKGQITGDFTVAEATKLANQINSGSLPFKLETSNYSTIAPTLGLGARDAMVLAGAIAFLLVCLFMILLYRLPGAVSTIALLGQVAGILAATSGFFGVFPSFTLTLPGIAGIILSIGMGVDANIITAERIREEFDNGKSIDGSIDAGFQRGFSAIFDGNITVIIVAVILMGTFGPPSSFFSKILQPIFFMFGPSTAGAIYSFGYTLLIGVILNFIMGVTASRLMLKSISKFKPFRKPFLYGGAK